MATTDNKPRAPTPDAIASLLSGLLGVPATTKVSPVPFPLTALKVFGTYIDDTGRLAWMCANDIAFAASTGAALAMVPPGVVNDSIKSGKLTETMVENAREVANVAANLFNTLAGHGHVRLRDYVIPTQALPPAIQQALTKPVLRLDLDVAVRGYPGGKIALFRILP